MGKIGVCLKRCFIVLTIVIMIISALLLAVTLFNHGYAYKEEQTENFSKGLHFMYSVGFITLFLSIIGVYGACTEKKWVLIVFTVGMILISLLLFVFVLLAVAAWPKFAEKMKADFENLMPLNNVTISVREHLDDIQEELQCCGFEQGYQDWGYNISESCLCHENSTNPCVAAPKDSQLFEESVDGQPVMIYGESCVPHMVSHVKFFLSTAMAVWLGIALITVLSAVLCIIMLCQLSKKDDVPPVIYSKEAKAGNYDALTDTVDYT